MTTRAVKLKAHGVKALEVYQLVTEEKPRASPGHVVVRMTVMPVNPSDWQPAMWTGIDLKDITVGGEGAGVVEEVRSGPFEMPPSKLSCWCSAAVEECAPVSLLRH